MKLLLYCMECPDDFSKPLFVEVEDKGIYLATCENGHKFVQTLSNPKFEILFEMALLALQDGYTRETVVTLAAAVEEFYRLFIKIVLVKKGMYQKDRLSELDNFWRIVNLSERQLGAFSALYFLEKGEAPTFPDKKSVEFRNDVVHKGKIPKRDEVVSYGEKIVKFLIPLWKEYREGDEHMIAAIIDITKTMNKEYGSLRKIGSSYPTVVNQMVSSTEYSFAEAIKLVGESLWLKK